MKSATSEHVGLVTFFTSKYYNSYHAHHKNKHCLDQKEKL